MRDFDYSQVPTGWALCFQADCPQASDCLRHHAARLMPKGVMKHMSVTPNARGTDGCRLFVADKPVLMARGMTHITKGYNPWEARDINAQLYECFGSRAQFYRYRQGQRPIPPEKQQQVADIFRRLGHDKAPVFDHLEEEFYFPTE